MIFAFLNKMGIKQDLFPGIRTPYELARRCGSWLWKHRMLLGIAAILAVGIYARWSDLAWHFSNNDDLRGIRIMLAGGKNHMPRIFAIPQQATNAPFQFIFSTFLLSPQMDYRELLFWGRLPSCVMGILALFAMLYFYKRWEPKDVRGVLLGLAILACSWENIAYAKQTYSYAIGVLALTLMLGFFAEFVRQEELSLKQWLMMSFGLAMVSNMQYQAHIFVVPFFAVLFFHQWSRSEDKRSLVFRFALAAFFYVALMFPTWYFFLWNKIGRGIPQWEHGPDPGMVLVLTKGASVWRHLSEAVLFYTGNLLSVFQSKLGFFPEDHPVFGPVSYLFFGFFLLGVVRCVSAREERRQLLGAFFLFSLGIWWALTAFHKITFSASRHTLILLPFFCVMVTEGASFFAEKVFPRGRNRFLSLARKWVVPGLAFGILAFFLTFFGQFLKERRDLVDGAEILRVLRTYNPDMVIYNEQTFGFKEMKELNLYLETVFNRQEAATTFSTIACVSRYVLDSMTLDKCDMARAFFNRESAKMEKQTGEPQPYLRYPCSDYKTVYSRKVRSKVQTDFTKKDPPEMYTNSLYIYVFRRK